MGIGDWVDGWMRWMFDWVGWCSNTVKTQYTIHSTQAKHGTGEQWTRCLKVPTIQLQCNMTWSRAHKTSNRRIRFCLIESRVSFQQCNQTLSHPLRAVSARLGQLTTQR